MRYYYGEKMPLRILDEGEFWKLQESEHTVVIRSLVPNLEPEFARALQQWEQALAQTQAVFTQYVEAVVRSANGIHPYILEQVRNLVQFSLYQSEQFVILLNQIGTQSTVIMNNPGVLVVLNHIRRESEYFIGTSRGLLAGNMI